MQPPATPQKHVFEMVFFGHIFNWKYFGTPKTIFRLSTKFKMAAMMTHLNNT